MYTIDSIVKNWSFGKTNKINKPFTYIDQENMKALIPGMKERILLQT